MTMIATTFTITRSTPSVCLSPSVTPDVIPVVARRLLSDAVVHMVRDIALAPETARGFMSKGEAIDDAFIQMEALFVHGLCAHITLDYAGEAVREARSFCVNEWVCPTSTLFRSVASPILRDECALLHLDAFVDSASPSLIAA